MLTSKVPLLQDVARNIWLVSSIRHITLANIKQPGYIEKKSELKAKGVDIIICLAYNDAFVMNAWAKANGIKDDSIVGAVLSLYEYH